MRYLLIVLAIALASGPVVVAQNLLPDQSETQTANVVASGACCLKPWLVPDRWTERSVPPNDVFDPGVDTYDGIGYTIPKDLGELIMFTLDNGASPTVKMGQYLALDFGNGADCYEKLISESMCNRNCCNLGTFAFGDTLVLAAKRGEMVGPTKRGIDNLIALDPGAKYDPQCKCVHSPQPWPWPWSRRIVSIAAFDPAAGFIDQHHAVLTKTLMVFIEGRDDRGNFWGRLLLVLEPCPAGVVADDCLKPWYFPPGLQVAVQHPVDITGDGRTDLSDLSALIKFLSGARSSASAPAMDVTGDGTVDLKDLAVLIEEVTGKNK